MSTAITRWRPFAEIEDLRKRMEHVSFPKPRDEARKPVTITPKGT